MILDAKTLPHSSGVATGVSRCALHRIGASSNVFFAGRPCPSTIHRQPLLRSSRADGRVISRAQCMLAHSTSTRSDAGAHAGGHAAGRAAGHAESALGGGIVCCSAHCVVTRELERQGLRRMCGGSIVWQKGFLCRSWKRFGRDMEWHISS